MKNTLNKPGESTRVAQVGRFLANLWIGRDWTREESGTSAFYQILGARSLLAEQGYLLGDAYNLLSDALDQCRARTYSLGE